MSKRDLPPGSMRVEMSTAEDGPGLEAAPAATVAVVRDRPQGLEVLLVRRSRTGSFGGMWVFPGGQVEVTDRDGRDQRAAADDDHGAGADGNPRAPGTEPDALGNVGAASEVAAARRAAAREAHEEAGLRLDPDHLAVLSFWLPPTQAPRRFATWFFVAAADPRADVRLDRAEVHDHLWVRPRHGQARRDRGEIQLAPPTWMTLQWLGQHPDVATAMADALAHPPQRFVTRVVLDDHGGLAATVWEGDEAYGDGDLDRPGPRRRLVVDPAGWRYESSG